jgi:hypothetical protein
MSSCVHVFVGGLHRSGTTLVARLLADHPAVSGLSDTGAPEDEGQHLQDVYPAVHQLGGVGRFGYSPSAHLTEASPFVSRDTRERLLASWRPYWSPNTMTVLEKSPPNILRTRFLQALFPEARFIIVVRHPIAVACATENWRGQTAGGSLKNRVVHGPLAWARAGSLIEHWLWCHEMLAADATHVEHLLVLRYETLVRDPTAALTRLQDFIKVAPRPSDLEVKGAINDRYFTRWNQRLSRPVQGSYLRRVTTRLEHRARRFGYSLRPPFATAFDDEPI